MVIFKRKESQEMFFIRELTRNLRLLSEVVSKLNQKVDSLTVPNPLSEDDWANIISKKEPEELNRINDVKSPNKWWENKRPPF